MKISTTEISMLSQHSSSSLYTRKESLNQWVGNRRLEQLNVASAATAPVLATSATPSLNLSAQGLATQAAEAAKDSQNKDPKLTLLELMLEQLTGERVRLIDVSDLAPSAAPLVVTGPGASTGSTATNTTRPAGFGMEYDLHESYAESEQTSVSASGVIKTTDGRTIDFTLDVSMSRSFYTERNVSIRAGDAVRKDPLVINFGGTAAELADQRFSFDLDGDGDKEKLAQFASASGYLALDKNGNGRIDNGKELFGPQTNSGYGELAAHDADNNGWIDENDAVFSQLKVWVPDNNGGKMMSLKEAGIGALALAHVGSQFGLRGSNNSDLGQVRETGMFLFENGRVGSLQEIDLTV